MPNFDYEAPTSLKTALGFLSGNGEIRPLAGGTDVIDQLKSNRRNADLVVDLKRVPELLALELDQGHLRIGAAVSCTEVHNLTSENDCFPALSEASELIGSIHIQNRASIGGNVCNAAPSADTIPPLLVHEAVAHTTSATGERQIPVIDFFAGPGQTVLQKGELLKELVLPVSSSNAASAYLRFIPRNEMDIAVAAAGASVILNKSGDQFLSARVALASVGPIPIMVEDLDVDGKPVDDDTIQSIAEAARMSAKPISDMRGTIEQRLHLVEVLTRRALQGAIQRARGV